MDDPVCVRRRRHFILKRDHVVGRTNAVSQRKLRALTTQAMAKATTSVDSVDGTRDQFPSRQGLKKLENPEAVKLAKLG